MPGDNERKHDDVPAAGAGQKVFKKHKKISGVAGSHTRWDAYKLTNNKHWWMMFVAQPSLLGRDALNSVFFSNVLSAVLPGRVSKMRLSNDSMPCMKQYFSRLMPGLTDALAYLKQEKKWYHFSLLETLSDDQLVEMAEVAAALKFVGESDWNVGNMAVFGPSSKLSEKHPCIFDTDRAGYYAKLEVVDIDTPIFYPSLLSKADYPLPDEEKEVNISKKAHGPYNWIGSSAYDRKFDYVRRTKAFTQKHISEDFRARIRRDPLATRMREAQYKTFVSMIALPARWVATSRDFYIGSDITGHSLEQVNRFTARQADVLKSLVQSEEFIASFKTDPHKYLNHIRDQVWQHNYQFLIDKLDVSKGYKPHKAHLAINAEESLLDFVAKLRAKRSDIPDIITDKQVDFQVALHPIIKREIFDALVSSALESYNRPYDEAEFDAHLLEVLSHYQEQNPGVGIAFSELKALSDAARHRIVSQHIEKLYANKVFKNLMFSNGSLASGPVREMAAKFCRDNNVENVVTFEEFQQLLTARHERELAKLTKAYQEAVIKKMKEIHSSELDISDMSDYSLPEERRRQIMTDTKVLYEKHIDDSFVKEIKTSIKEHAGKNLPQIIEKYKDPIPKEKMDSVIQKEINGINLAWLGDQQANFISDLYILRCLLEHASDDQKASLAPYILRTTTAKSGLFDQFKHDWLADEALASSSAKLKQLSKLWPDCMKEDFYKNMALLNKLIHLKNKVSPRWLGKSVRISNGRLGPFPKRAAKMIETLLSNPHGDNTTTLRIILGKVKSNDKPVKRHHDVHNVYHEISKNVGISESGADDRPVSSVTVASSPATPEAGIRVRRGVQGVFIPGNIGEEQKGGCTDGQAPDHLGND